MEAAGFARAGVPGEYSPFVVSTYRAASATQSSSASFQNTLTQEVVVETLGEVLTAIFSCNTHQDFSGGTPVFRVSVDGVPYAYSANSAAVGGEIGMIHVVVPVTGLLPGPHTVAVAWKCDSPANLLPFLGGPPITDSQHVSLLCFRNRPTSDRELNGVPQRGWHMIYSEGTVFAKLVTPSTSNAATPTTPLLTGLQFVSRYAQSSLLIRFSASATALDSGARRSNTFHVYVDNVFVAATGSETGAVGTGACSNAALVVVTPVQAGVHVLNVYWAGSASGSGSSIDPSNQASHAHVSVEEVFSADQNMLSDMEGFATVGFSSRNLPRVYFAKLTTDGPGIDQDYPILERLAYVTGEQSALQVEFTASTTNFDGYSAVCRMYLDGVLVKGVTTNGGGSGSGGLIEGLAMHALLPVAPGNHKVVVTYRNRDNDTLEAGTHPEYAHAHMLVREVALQVAPTVVT